MHSKNKIWLACMLAIILWRCGEEEQKKAPLDLQPRKHLSQRHQTSDGLAATQEAEASHLQEKEPNNHIDILSKVTAMSNHFDKNSQDLNRLIKDTATLTPPSANDQEEAKPICENIKDTSNKNICPIYERIDTEGKTLICSKQKYSLTKTTDKFIAINPYADALWPGSLVQIAPLVDGRLDPIPTQERAPGFLTMTIATSSTGSFSAQIDEPSLASTTEAIKDILFQNLEIPTPAKFYYKMHRIYSKEQLKVALGLHVNTQFDLGLDFRFDTQTLTSRNNILMEFTQEYYTMAFTPNSTNAGFFKISLRPEDLENYTSANNPIGYISSVTYGRKIYLLFESSVSMIDLETAIKASFQASAVSGRVDLAVKYQNIINDSYITTYILGGHATKSLTALNNSNNEDTSLINFKTLLVEGANFSESNPGVPISYTVRHIKDASQLKLALTTTYEVKECHANTSIGNSANAHLKVTLTKMEIDKEHGFCELPLDDTGEFSTCLRAQLGTSEEKMHIFCSNEIRKAKAGETIIYGQSNHSMLIDVPQVPEQRLTFFGEVLEYDSDKDKEEILSFTKNFQLNHSFQWLDWQDHVAVTGVKNGCKATLHFSLEWLGS